MTTGGGVDRHAHRQVVATDIAGLRLNARVVPSRIPGAEKYAPSARPWFF